MSRASHLLRSAALGTLAIVVGVGFVSCGSGDRTFSAEEFIATANEHDAGLILGAPLDAGGETEVYALSFAGVGAGVGATGPGAGVDVHGGGALTVKADSDAGLAEYNRCESAATLICFRVANISLIFEGVSPSDLARLEAAVRSMASDESE